VAEDRFQPLGDQAVLASFADEGLSPPPPAVVAARLPAYARSGRSCRVG